MYELPDPAKAQRMTLAGIAGVWVALAWWQLLGPGLRIAGIWFGWIGNPGDEVRRICLAAGFSIYYIRILFTEFIFLKRGVSRSEVLAIAPWLLCIVALLPITGGTNPAPVGWAAAVVSGLFAAGSWMISYGEYARHVWKLRLENRGQLYTQGLFLYSTHPNYFGDLLSFSGLWLISEAWITTIVPILMPMGFVFLNIPVLDSHLCDHYGSAFSDYMRRTAKLIPFVY
jgi:protein-S-isoprenylcysteine O-methyltransferase Ste14